MKDLTETLRKRFSSYGHFKVSIELDGETLTTTTTNTMAIDAAFDDCYDLEVDEGRYYESQMEAKEALVDEILKHNLPLTTKN